LTLLFTVVAPMWGRISSIVATNEDSLNEYLNVVRKRNERKIALNQETK
jgi:site-specific recombinase